MIIVAVQCSVKSLSFELFCNLFVSNKVPVNF